MQELQHAARKALVDIRKEEIDHSNNERNNEIKFYIDENIYTYSSHIHENRGPGKRYRRKPLKRGMPKSSDGKNLDAEVKRTLREISGGIRPETIITSNTKITDWCIRFINKFYSEIFDIICKKSAKDIAKAADASSKGTLTALAAWLTASAGMTSPVALGIAVIILMVIAAATKGAFCAMAREQFEKSLPESRKPTDST